MLSYKFQGEEIEDDYDNTYVSKSGKSNVSKFDLDDED